MDAVPRGVREHGDLVPSTEKYQGEELQCAGSSISQEVRSSSPDAKVAYHPWGKDYIPKQHMVSIPTDRDRAYTFFCKSSVSDIRNLAKLCSAKQEGVKNTIISNLMVSAAAIGEKVDSDWIMVFGKELRNSGAI